MIWETEPFVQFSVAVTVISLMTWSIFWVFVTYELCIKKSSWSFFIEHIWFTVVRYWCWCQLGSTVCVLFYYFDFWFCGWLFWPNKEIYVIYYCDLLDLCLFAPSGTYATCPHPVLFYVAASIFQLYLKSAVHTFLCQICFPYVLFYPISSVALCLWCTQ